MTHLAPKEGINLMHYDQAALIRADPAWKLKPVWLTNTSLVFPFRPTL
jgi:hypothetical protein